MTTNPATKSQNRSLLPQSVRFILAVLCLNLFMGFGSLAHAQRSEFQGFRRSVATVIFAGLGGAVLGLSTLSFYGEPQDHTGNIYAGLAAGIIAGTAYVLMSSSEPGYAQQSLIAPRLQLASFRSPQNEKTGIRQIPVASYAWTF